MFRNKLYILLLLFTSSICSAQIINTIGVYYEINSTKPLFISNRPVLSGDTLEYMFVKAPSYKVKDTLFTPYFD